MIRVIVYTSGGVCMQCQLTKRVMDAAGISYAEVDLSDPANDASRDYVARVLGYRSVPVVVVDEGHHWSGFLPDRIGELASRLAQSATAGEA